MHKNSGTPFKRKKNSTLSEEEKAANRDLSKKRITVEHIFRRLKVFRILREQYRNRRKRFSLRFNIIAACCNLAVRLNDRHLCKRSTTYLGTTQILKVFRRHPAVMQRKCRVHAPLLIEKFIR
ncbi:MAG: transposase family protein [Candidatus Electronema sp. VV]